MRIYSPGKFCKMTGIEIIEQYCEENWISDLERAEMKAAAEEEGLDGGMSHYTYLRCHALLPGDDPAAPYIRTGTETYFFV